MCGYSLVPRSSRKEERGSGVLNDISSHGAGPMAKECHNYIKIRDSSFLTTLTAARYGL